LAPTMIHTFVDTIATKANIDPAVAETADDLVSNSAIGRLCNGNATVQSHTRRRRTFGEASGCSRSPMPGQKDIAGFSCATAKLTTRWGITRHAASPCVRQSDIETGHQHFARKLLSGQPASPVTYCVAYCYERSSRSAHLECPPCVVTKGV